MKKDPWSDEALDPKPRKTGAASTILSEDKKEKKTRTTKSWFDNPPARIEITYRNGEQDILVEDEIDADNPVIQALANIRTVRRFWRLNKPCKAGDEVVYSTDEELVKYAMGIGYTTNDPVELGKAMNMVAEYFITGEDGEPAEDAKGDWIKAKPADRDYKSGSHKPAGDKPSAK